MQRWKPLYRWGHRGVPRVGQNVHRLEEGQSDVELAENYLLRTDPEDAISAVDERLGRAEQVVQSQHLRNEAGDLQARMKELRERQEALKAKLGATVGKRSKRLNRRTLRPVSMYRTQVDQFAGQ